MITTRAPDGALVVSVSRTIKSCTNTMAMMKMMTMTLIMKTVLALLSVSKAYLGRRPLND